MLDSLKDTFSTVGETTSDYARRLGCSTRALARRVGPKRGIAALVILAAGVGTAFGARRWWISRSRSRAFVSASIAGRLAVTR
jgi:hypothetical protein